MIREIPVKKAEHEQRQYDENSPIIMWGFKGEGNSEYIKIIVVYPDDGGVENGQHFMEKSGYNYVSFSGIKELNDDYHKMVDKFIINDDHIKEEGFMIYDE